MNMTVRKKGSMTREMYVGFWMISLCRKRSLQKALRSRQDGIADKKQEQRRGVFLSVVLW